MTRSCILAVLAYLCLLQGSLASLKYVKMKYGGAGYQIMQQGGKAVIPVRQDDEQPVKVSVNLKLIDILKVDKENNNIEAIIWQETSWTDPRYTWDSSDEYSNYTNERVPGSSIWRPDFAFYNSHGKPEMLVPDIAVVTSEGHVIWVPSYRIQFWCDLHNVDTTEGAECSIKVGSWTYSGLSLTLVPPGPGAFSLSAYHQNPKYSILKTGAEREVKHYDCCPEPYEDIKFTFTLRSREETRASHGSEYPVFSVLSLVITEPFG